MQLPLRKIIKNGMAVEIDWMRSQEQEAVRTLLNKIIIEGKTYPQNQPLSPGEFAAYWLNQAAFVVRAVTDDQDKNDTTEVLAAFYLKPNFPGRCSHISNAGFIVRSELRGQGIGRLMGEAMLEIAPTLGYKAVMFNLVFETNIPSIRLWQSLGFEIIGRIPAAVNLSNGRFVDALIMYLALS